MRVKGRLSIIHTPKDETREACNDKPVRTTS